MTTLFSVHGTSGSLGECGPACYEAKEERCSCVCGGANHAIGQAGALRWTTENAEHLRAKYEGLGYKVNLHVQLGLPLAGGSGVHTLRGTENQEGAKMAEETKKERTLTEIRAAARRDSEVAGRATPGPWKEVHCWHEHYVYAPDARYESLPGNDSPVKVAYLPPSPASDRPLRDSAHVVHNDPERVAQRCADTDYLIGLVEQLGEALRAARNFTHKQEYSPKTTRDIGEMVTLLADPVLAKYDAFTGKKGA